jgi:hypothetical protein
VDEKTCSKDGRGKSESKGNGTKLIKGNAGNEIPAPSLLFYFILNTPYWRSNLR